MAKVCNRSDQEAFYHEFWSYESGNLIRRKASGMQTAEGKKHEMESILRYKADQLAADVGRAKEMIAAGPKESWDDIKANMERRRIEQLVEEDAKAAAHFRRGKQP